MPRVNDFGSHISIICDNQVTAACSTMFFRLNSGFCKTANLTLILNSSLKYDAKFVNVIPVPIGWTLMFVSTL